MKSRASAPAKAILFGEHAVVYGKPAIAAAVDRRVTVTLGDSSENRVTIPSLGVDFRSESSPRGGILDYVGKTLKLYHDGSPLSIQIEMEIPVGSGLGSSAALTVALIGALDEYHGRESEPEDTAARAHRVELEVQGAASPLDTTVSTYGGLVYLDSQRNVEKVNARLHDLVIAHLDHSGDTAEMVAGVAELRSRFPDVMDGIMDAVEMITMRAYRALMSNSPEPIGDLMNINQGLLDAMGVSTGELSMMVYEARSAGAAGSKITGAGGGGSIIAYCPGCAEDVAEALNRNWNAMKARFSEEGLIR
ncbi:MULTISPECIES: mevalonate kinase [Methanothermobacter]|uniref:Mevalonate kinase n=1 Tax=Methanothermobacter marburgensis (strain ATCC BAA-927 / DSM 2133 / JCM 14651 / NBRC 100331 / OCM 82 / Marburg) TaxID=79929 RepID=D9PV82_METTM|nr:MULTISPECIES: mevalonate kinase [Methanothermobacter]ADL58130.1 predicted mevalonate kinase [Methanothermobacter marburgensis str. Marburg]QEF94015.1 mevalonate kinase [Methanothermobacter sp. KEPCO-1]QHN08557.1 mevalonate kinase [Methanothermobacter sp. THM-2]WBF10310.1 mevalonate kinase [Methanothermobacter marburgensis]BAM69294.1 mevalonate kinase [Methanothermobacter sp. CaT2]